MFVKHVAFTTAEQDTPVGGLTGPVWVILLMLANTLPSSFLSGALIPVCQSQKLMHGLVSHFCFTL